MPDMKSFINKVADGTSLSATEASKAFDLMMSGEASEGQIAGFLMALRVRGETIEEITGAATTMRAKATPVSAPANAVDVCGTGGDAKGTYNISTCVSFVLAACDVPVAKHGNRSISSKSGAADVLEVLGVNLGVTPEQVSACIEKANVGFMFAQSHHSAMKHVMPARLALGTRTIFNLLGPLTNPAGAKAQLLGVFSDQWVEPLAHVLKNLGATSAWVVHGSDGLDELTTTGSNFVAQLKDGEITQFTITPQDAGLASASPDDLLGGDARQNADAILDVLSGKAGAFRDIVQLNTGAALVVANKAQNIKQGAQLAAAAIDSGAAQTALDQLIATSNS
ncbi:MAG: anthranilate phosphoribosyltransferase [Hyphomicrobiaceae bacterium]|nr:anthranilate phosphoribosyltransferase [Hyphomicrobiaceae bacterium]